MKEDSTTVNNAVELQNLCARIAQGEFISGHHTDEQVAVATILPAMCERACCEFPLTLIHRDKPDFMLRCDHRSIGVEVRRLTQLVPFLATAGNTAPFIGLFGTVWGIMNTFQGIGLSGSASLAVVAPGISEALVATAAGLAVAIPAVIAYNYFTDRIRVLDSELQSFSSDLLNIIEKDIQKVIVFVADKSNKSISELVNSLLKNDIEIAQSLH